MKSEMFLSQPIHCRRCLENAYLWFTFKQIKTEKGSWNKQI